MGIDSMGSAQNNEAALQSGLTRGMCSAQANGGAPAHHRLTMTTLEC